MSASSTNIKKKTGRKEPAPGMQIRCLKCDCTEPWEKQDGRLKAAGRTYTFGRCPQCKRIRMRVIEKTAI